MTEEFSLFTSLRYDPKLIQVRARGLADQGWNFDHDSPFYMLDYHRDRMLKASKHWRWQPAIDKLTGDEGLQYLKRLLTEAVGTSQTTPSRIRVVVSREGDIKVENFSTPELSLDNLFPRRLPPPTSVLTQADPPKQPHFLLLVDAAETARSEFTHFKTTKRAMYDSARHRAGLSPADAKEVLVINQDDGSVMEGTITTPYFWRDNRWVTPPVSTKFSREDGNGGQDGTSRRWALER